MCSGNGQSIGTRKDLSPKSRRLRYWKKKTLDPWCFSDNLLSKPSSFRVS